MSYTGEWRDEKYLGGRGKRASVCSKSLLSASKSKAMLVLVCLCPESYQMPEVRGHESPSLRAQPQDSL